MKPEEMIVEVEELTHESFEPDTWMRWFNRGLQDLAPVIRLEGYEEFTVNGSSRDLPGDVLRIREVYLDNTKLHDYGIGSDKDNAYWVWEGALHFPESKTGKIKLWYFRRPAIFTLGSARPDIQEGWEDAIILYAAAKSKAPDRWLPDKSDFYQDYLLRKAQIEKERNEQLARPRIAAKRRWR